jgi:uncharacterized protein
MKNIKAEGYIKSLPAGVHNSMLLLDSNRYFLHNPGMGTRLAGIFLWAAAAVGAQGTEGIVGTWQGTLNAGAVKLRMAIHVARDDKGNLVTKIDSLDQGANGIAVQETTFADRKLHLDMPNMRATYDGTLDGDQITGTFTQGAPIPLVFKRVDKIEALNRPQNPKPPFPYESVDVAYENQAGGVHLAGTLTVPRGTGPFPAAILITGSGPQDRDESLMEHKPFWVIADSLTRRGIAVLRVDDRGVGKSTGNSVRTTIQEMAGDVLTGVEFLKGRKEIDAKRIGVIGHSEGGIVGPIAASRSSDVAFVVMLAGTGVTGEQVMLLQSELVIRASGGGDAGVAQNRALQNMLFNAMRAEQDEKDEKVILEKLREAWAKMKAGFNPLERASINPNAEKAIEGQFTLVSAPEMRSFIFHDPAEVLRKVKVPVLVMNGSRDVQVSAKQNLPAIVAALTAGGNDDFTAVELPGLNHLFQKCKTCSPAEYGELEETFSPAALQIVGDWVVRHTGHPD